jgi:hypothetical protein
MMTKFEYYFYMVVGYSLFLLALMLLAMIGAVILDYYLGGGM